MLSGKVKEWICTSGFSLEMEAANAFRAAGFDVTQSAIYSDPQTAKGREIDVLARDPDFVGIITISFVLECKSSTKPWVVLLPENGSVLYNRLLTFGVTSESVKSKLAASIVNGHVPQYIEEANCKGYAFRQALTKDADPAFVAAAGVLNACVDLMRDRESTNSIPGFSFAIPVIVVDSPLFECRMQNNGELELNEVTYSDFLFSGYMPKRLACRINVVTRTHLSEYALGAKRLADRIRNDFKVEQEKVFGDQARS